MFAEHTLIAVLEGLSYKMIAVACDISINTVRKHFQNIYPKLQVPSVTEAIRLGIKEKIGRL